MKLKSLLSQLEELESALRSFSIEELSISEASRLKSSFEVFKNRFEDNFYGRDYPNQDSTFPEQEPGSKRQYPPDPRGLHTPLKGIVDNPKGITISEEAVSAEIVQGLNILVFEDDTINQWVMKKRLTSWGCKHYVTDNANDGLNILQEQKIDLVLMDLHLPGTDGFEITEMIRQSPLEQVYNVPVIAISADILIADDVDWQEKGIDDFILKPYPPEELLTKMISAIHLYKEDRMPPVQNNTQLEAKQMPALDLQPLLSEFLGQGDLVVDFARLYKQNIQEYIGQVKQGLQQEDVDRIEFAAHKIKNSLRMIPTPALLGIVEAVHTMSRKDPDFGTMRRLHEAFIMHYPKVERELDDALELLKT